MHHTTQVDGAEEDYSMHYPNSCKHNLQTVITAGYSCRSMSFFRTGLPHVIRISGGADGWQRSHTNWPST